MNTPITNKSNSSQREPVPLLVRVNSASQNIKKSLISNFNGSEVKSQYFYEQQLKISSEDNFGNSFNNNNNQGLKQSINKQSIMRQLDFMNGIQNSRRQQTKKSNNYLQDQSNDHLVGAINYQQQQSKQSNSDLYNYTLQLFYKYTKIFSNQHQRFQQNSKQTLSSILTNNSKLILFLQNLQMVSLKSRDSIISKDFEILSCLLIKLLNRKNNKNNIIKPQVYLNQNNIYIDFDPSNDKKQKQQKILILRKQLKQKQIQMTRIRQQYDLIIENYAQAMINLNNSQKLKIHKLPNWNKTANKLKLLRKDTFAYHNTSNQQEQYINL